MDASRRLPWDWHDGTIPRNVEIDDDAYVETSLSFMLYRSKAPLGVRFGRGSSAYAGTMFDMGPRGRVDIGEFVLINGARIICDDRIEIGDYCLISWNVVLMDTYRLSADPAQRRRELERVPQRQRRHLEGASAARPIRIGPKVWIGFDVCVMPGVTIGEGAVVGAKSVVFEDVAPFTVVAGNPARFIRRLEDCPEGQRVEA